MEGPVLLGEEVIERAVNAFATRQHTMAEGAGAAGLAAMLQEPDRFRGRTVGLVLCGGNIDARLLASIMVRELERDDRILSLRITASDRPGILGHIASRLGELKANILEVSHGRLMLDVPAKGVTIDITVETREPSTPATSSQRWSPTGWRRGASTRAGFPKARGEPARRTIA